MADLRITEAVSQAEAAIETGNYDGAIETCQRILGQFPEFAAAHRVLGEAYAEQGELDAAKQAYQRTLERDPQSAAAHVGLGLIAEEANDKRAALAHFQVAWEIDPRRRDLREHVSRLSQEIYGEEGRLYLTRAALTSLHFHAGRWDRSVSEAAQVLQEYSSRIDVQVRMAEALWRRGDDEQAMQVSSTILRTLPLAVVPLLIQADIHRRRGSNDEAQDLLSQARAIDPDGVRAADLIMVGLDDQAEFLMVEDIPTIDDSVLAEEPAARYAPAPDFMAETDTLVSADESADEARDSAVDEEVVGAPENLQPFRWEDVGDEDLETSDLEPPVESESSDVVQAEEESASVSFELYTDEELDEARPTGEHPSGFTGYLKSLDSEGMQPFDPEDSGDTWAETDDDSDLGEAAAEESVEAELSGDPLDLDWNRVDEEIEGAIPGETPRGYTDELRSIEDSGVQPFSFDDASGDDIIPDELIETGPDHVDFADLSASLAEVEAETTGDDDFDALTRDWASEDDSEGETTVLDPGVVGDETVDEFFGEFATGQVEDIPETTELTPLTEEDSITDDLSASAGAELVAEFESEKQAEIDQLAVMHRSEVLESAARLGLQEELFARVRSAKAELVEQGYISGDERLPGTGPTIDDLRAEVDADPDNANPRIALATALVDVDSDDAIEEFRWLYRNASDRSGEILDDFVRMLEMAEEPQPKGHRLLAAIYRRNGEWLAAATHYEASLTGVRRS